VIVTLVIVACAIGSTAAFGLLVAADYFAFARILSPPFAALAAAGTAILFCAVAVLLGTLVLARTKTRVRRRMHTRIVGLLGEIFGKELLDATDRHPLGTLAAILVAGFALGFSPTLRNTFLRTFLRR